MIHQNLIPIFGIVFAVALPIALSGYVIALFIRSRHKERLEMIKSGAILDEARKTPPNVYTSLRNGFLYLGVGLGAFIGTIASINLDYELPIAIVVVAATASTFLGLAYVIFYFVTKDKLEENSRN